MSVPPDILSYPPTNKGNKMGLTTAMALEEDLSLEAGLAYHLQANHYPPVPVAMVQPCIDAIDAFYDEDYERLIELPGDITWRGQSSAPASAIADAHHLEAWLPHAHYCDCEDCVI